MTDEELEQSLIDVDRQLAVHRMLQEVIKLRDALRQAQTALSNANWAVIQRREALIRVLERVKELDAGADPNRISDLI